MSRYGAHNPILNVHRYLDYGAISFKAAAMLAQVTSREKLSMELSN